MKDITFNEISKQFAVWKHGDSEELVMVQSGYFASDQWLKTGNTGDVLGEKFGILGYDGRPGWVSRYNIRPLKDMEEFDSFKNTCPPVFKRILDLHELDEQIVSCIDVDYYRHFGKCSYFSEFLYFLKSKSGVWESAHFIYNENQSGLPKCVVHDRDTEYDSFESMADALKEGILEAQGESFLDDLDKHLQECQEKGKCFIFYVG